MRILSRGALRLLLGLLCVLLLGGCSTSGDTVSSPRDLEGKIAGCYAPAFPLSHYEEVTQYGANVRSYDSPGALAGAVADGSVDCAVCYSATLPALQAVSDKLKPTGESLGRRDFAFITAPESVELEKKISSALRALEEEGVIAAILAEYAGEDPTPYIPEDKGEDAPTLTCALAGLCAPYVLAAGDTYTGIEVDIALAVGDRLGVHIQFLAEEDADSAIRQVQAGRVHFALGCLARAEESEDPGVLYSRSYLTEELLILVRK